MTNLTAALAMVPAVFGFQSGQTYDYTMTAKFDGFLPILGGAVGVVDVEMGVRVRSLDPVEGRLKVTNEISDFAMKFGGAPLPFGLEDVNRFFPRTSVELTPLGQVVKNDAPNLSLPIRLPGLDVKRFPDITYLPVVFPEGGVAEGQSWSFTKKFGDTEVSYQATATQIEGDLLTLDVDVEQEFTVYEDAALQTLPDEKNAVTRATTKMTGEGTVVFDLSRGVATETTMVNTAVTTPVDPKTGKIVTREVNGEQIGERKLVTTLNVKLDDPNAAPRMARAQPKEQGDWWATTQRWGMEAWRRSQAYVALARIALAEPLANASQLWPRLLGAVYALLGQFVPMRPGIAGRLN